MTTASTSSPPGQQTIRLAFWGPDATGRTLGREVRESVEPAAEEVLFDCEGIDAMSPSFADEVFGKLAEQAERPHIKIINATPEVLDTIRFAVSQRTAA
jgi:hypothetical protein